MIYNKHALKQDLVLDLDLYDYDLYDVCSNNVGVYTGEQEPVPHADEDTNVHA